MKTQKIVNSLLITSIIFSSTLPVLASSNNKNNLINEIEMPMEYQNSLLEVDNTPININLDFVIGQEVTLEYDDIKVIIKDNVKEGSVSRTARNYSRTLSIYDTSTSRDIWVGDILKTAAGTSGGGVITHNQLSIHSYTSRTLNSNPSTPNLRVNNYNLRNNGSNNVIFETQFSFRRDNGTTRNGVISMGLLTNGGTNVMIW